MQRVSSLVLLVGGLLMAVPATFAQDRYRAAAGVMESTAEEYVAVYAAGVAPDMEWEAVRGDGHAVPPHA